MKYFIEREKQHIEQMLQNDRKTKREIERILIKARQDIEQQIADLQRTYAASQNMTVSELLREADKMDVQRMSDRVKLYVRTKDFSPQANRELKLYNYKMRTSRLELIKAQINLELTTAMSDVEKYIGDDLYNDARNEFSRQAGILKQTVPKRLNKQIEAIINGSYLVDDTDNFIQFSTAMWGYKKVLQAEVERLVIRAVLMGQHPRVTAKELVRVFNVTVSQAVRLARTESTRIQTEIQQRMYLKAGVTHYMVIGEPDACKHCQPYLNKKFRVDEWIYTPPFHPHCRCSTVPVVDTTVQA